MIRYTPSKAAVVFVTGNGDSRPCRAAGTSSQPKIPSNEMELLWKVFPLGKFTFLLHLPSICHHFCSTTYG